MPAIVAIPAVILGGSGMGILLYELLARPVIERLFGDYPPEWLERYKDCEDGF
jgi:hypothetical protein